MFDQELKDMTAVVTVEPGMFDTITASNVGVSPDLVFCGGHEYDFHAALDVINNIDRALLSCPKYLYKRIKAQRMSFVFAFGPEMEGVVGNPPAPRS